jgi:hypothetical protein
VVVAVRARSKLSHGGEAGIGRLPVRKRREASLAHSLVSVDLREIGLVHRASADVLGLQAGRRSKLRRRSTLLERSDACLG